LQDIVITLLKKILQVVYWPTYHKFESFFCQNSKVVQDKIAKYICQTHTLRNLTN